MRCYKNAEVIRGIMTSQLIESPRPSSRSTGSVTRWLRSPHDQAAAPAAELLWHRFGFRLVRLARWQLRYAGDHAYDEEDLALSTLFAFYQRAVTGKFQSISNRHQLWKLLVTISLNKSHNIRRRTRRQKHVAFPQEFSAEGQGSTPTLDSATWIIEMADHCDYLLHILDEHDPTGVLKTITLLRLDGTSVSRIARHLSCTRRTVNTRLALIQSIWQSYLAEYP